MYKDTDPQGPLFDVKTSLSEGAQRRLEQSWAHGFARDIYPCLLEVESQFAHLYGSTGRPNWSVARMLGVCLLQEMLDLDDQRAVDALVFDARWRFALGFGADEDSYLSRQGLVEFRSRLAARDPEATLLDAVFEHITQQALNALGLSTSRQRIDSSLVRSNIRERGRAELLLATLRHALRAISRTDETLIGKLSESLQSWLHDKEERGWFGDSGPRVALEQAGEWLAEVVFAFEGHPEVSQLEEFQLARRALHENFDLEPDPDPDPGSPKRKLKTKKHSMKADHDATLQSPHDPDAAKGHKGRGYSLQLVETCGNEGCELITAFELHPANVPDQGQAEQLLEKLKRQGRQPDLLLADAGYVTPRSIMAVQNLGSYLLGPMYRTEHQLGFTRLDFVYADNGEVLECPAGQRPTRHSIRKYERSGEEHLHAFFDPEQCNACPVRAACPVSHRKHGAWLALVPRLHLRALRWREQRDPAWWAEYGIRSGVEATFSELKRAHGCDKLRVRRRTRMRAAIGLKLTACNVKRWLRARG